MDRAQYVQLAKERFGDPETVAAERHPFTLNRQHAGVLAAVVKKLVRRDGAGHPVIKEPRPGALAQRCDRSITPMLACGWVAELDGVFVATPAGQRALAAYRRLP
jgi:hypothetical protein